MQAVTLLQQVPLFASLKPDQLTELASKLNVRSYQRGETIFHIDDPGAVLYIIKEGQVKIIIRSPEGDEAILAIFSNGDFFGELSLLDEEPRSASAVAMVSTGTLTLHRHDLLDFIARHPGLASDMLATLSRRLRCTDLMLEDAVFLDLPARLAKRLLELSEKHGVKIADGVEIGLRLTQQDLADLIGATREAVNKQLRLYQARGIIHIERNHLTLLQPDELRRCIY